MTQFNRHEFPPNGWAFRQPQTSWTNPMAMVGFDASVKAIVQHRLANKAITIKHNLSTDPGTVANELERYTRLRLGIPDDPPPTSFFQPGRSPSPSGGQDAAAGANWFRRIVRQGAGVSTLADWLGTDGVPVAAELAEQRAAICSDCPQNKQGDLLAFFTKPVADLLRRQLEERRQLNLSTSRDAQLNVCDACGCPLKLKVHVPLNFIRKHMRQQEMGLLDPRCWILREG